VPLPSKQHFSRKLLSEGIKHRSATPSGSDPPLQARKLACKQWLAQAIINGGLDILLNPFNIFNCFKLFLFASDW
jgi:hypothetical protein